MRSTQTSRGWRAKALAAAATIAALSLLAACSGGGGGDTGGTGEAVEGKTLVAAQPVDLAPSSFLKTTFGNILAEYAVFETLTLISPESGEPEGVLASSWEIAPDQLSMDITLRDDVTFHSGKKFTADDVIFTLEKVQDPAEGAANEVIAANISAMDKISDTELKLTFAQPEVSMFDLFESMPIVNSESYADNAAGEVVDGTGRFSWDKWTPGSTLELKKYDGYRDAANTTLAGIEVQVIADASAMLSAVRSGSVQYAIGIPASDSTVLAQDPAFALVKTGGSSESLAFDVTQAPFDKPEVRQAIAYAIDRDRINDQVYGGQSRPTDLFWKEASPGYDEEQSNLYGYDMDKAAQLLASAGVSNTSFDLLAVNDPATLGAFQIIQNSLAELGLNATVTAVDSADYDQRKASGQMGAPVYLIGATESQSPGATLQTRVELRAEDNLTGFSSPEYTSLIQDVTTATDPEVIREALRAYNEYFLDQAFVLPIVQSQNISVRSSDVDGIGGTQAGFIRLDTASFTS
ncbi:Glutathione-binding protein GsiB [Microbacterium lemovicicum]|uniref:Glutathione-binding protein GsiB n=1 Tax=Microbacterium lemovicicum TaxID=1072463 RepID=A0A3S9W6Y7_9MICO|nr:ABC transporter substrate-binding protein [Microbacterium lemovicicum]AZS35713.1 Glutathione-binding protein GsiB [Microbacterium lemovicicum]